MALASLVSHRQEVGTFSGTIHIIPTYVFRIRWAPCSCIISPRRMLYFNHFCSSRTRESALVDPVILANLVEGASYWTRSRLPEVSENLRAVWLQSGCQFCITVNTMCLTPARTLVMSSTRIPARGKVKELVAAVARFRYLVNREPLRADFGLHCLTRACRDFVTIITPPERSNAQFVA